MTTDELPVWRKGSRIHISTSHRRSTHRHCEPLPSADCLSVSMMTVVLYRDVLPSEVAKAMLHLSHVNNLSQQIVVSLT